MLISSYSQGITNYTTDCGYDLYCPDKLTVPAKAISRNRSKIQTKMEDKNNENIGIKYILEVVWFKNRFTS